MNAPTSIRSCTRFGFAVLAALLAVGVLGTASAQAGVFFSFGGPFGYYGPYYGAGPYYGYPGPYYYPYAYYPPSYYAPPAYAYYPPAPSAPTPAPSTYTPAAPQAMAVPPAPSSTSSAAAGITYTSKPAFTNSAGQTCREYKSSSSGRDVFGTACRQSDGQWRVVN